MLHHRKKKHPFKNAFLPWTRLRDLYPLVGPLISRHLTNRVFLPVGNGTPFSCHLTRRMAYFHHCAPETRYVATKRSSSHKVLLRNPTCELKLRAAGAA